MGRERERKYLVRNEDWRRDAGSGVAYVQGYLTLDPERSVRIRTAGEEGVLTIKGASHAGDRAEFEYPIPLPDAREMLESLCLRPLIEKTRYVVECGGGKWEIDEFSGGNAGLVVAELELGPGNERFQTPEWLGPEVTGDPRYFNQNLVREPYVHWRSG
jgi:adenylate cyclase